MIPEAFKRSRVVHKTQGRLSYYYRSCHMMDYIVHPMNMTLCDNICVKLATPNYHPYILCLYCGLLFWIQCLRAGSDVNALTELQYQFLDRFFDNYPLETLAVPCPLLQLFKTICSSQPEFPHYGKVYPHVPVQPGLSRRDAFMRNLLKTTYPGNKSLRE